MKACSLGRLPRQYLKLCVSTHGASPQSGRCKWSLQHDSVGPFRFHHSTTTTALASVEEGAGARATPLVAQRRPGRPWVVLGIESSCDDTGAAVVCSDGRVLGEALATQEDIHAPWGGVVPSLAREAHKRAIDSVVDQALAQAGMQPGDLDAIAVTIGPGLSLCLTVGVLKARQLAAAHDLPVVAVHHMEAHALVARLGAGAGAAAMPAATATPPLPLLATSVRDNSGHAPPDATLAAAAGAAGMGSAAAEAVAAAATGAHAPPFPFLCLLVSGGHNLLVLVSGVGRYTLLGSTLDDALGEAYDKVARLLQLDLRPSGGAALEALARRGDPLKYRFSLPMKKHRNCDFSYAGLKTATRLCIQANLPPPPQRRLPAVAPAPAAWSGWDEAAATGAAAAAVAEAVAAAAAAEEASAVTSTSELAPWKTEEALQTAADIAASFQYVGVSHLCERVARATEWARELAPQLGHLVVAGGVASNQYVRAQLAQVAAKQRLQLVLPPPRWCVDNGVMVAWAGIERLEAGMADSPLPATSSVSMKGNVVPAGRPAPSGPTPPQSDLELALPTLNSAAAAVPQASTVIPPAAAMQPPRLSESPPQPVNLAQHVLEQVMLPGGLSTSSSDSTSSSGGSSSSSSSSSSVQPQRYKAASADAVWVEVRARWPLTSESHPRYGRDDRIRGARSAKKRDVHTSFDDLVSRAEAGATATAAGPAPAALAAAVASGLAPVHAG